MEVTIGIVVGMLILNYVIFEFSYDKIHKNSDRIYRVESQFYEDDELTDDWATSSFGYASAMKKHFSGIEDFVRIDVSNTERIISYKANKYRENKIVVTEPSFLSIFSFSLIKGNIKDALTGPNKVVITKLIANKYFGEINPIGEILTISTNTQILKCEVSGVLDKFPENSSFNYDFFISWETLPTWKKDFWYLHEVYSYVLLSRNASSSTIEQGFPEMAEQYKTKKALKNKKWAIKLNPLKKLHFSPQKRYEKEIKGNYKGIIALILAALAILIIAWINYIILTTILSLERAKEVGVRKSIGVNRKQLVVQFMLEALIANLISFVLALIIIGTVSPFFNAFIEKDIPLIILDKPLFWGGLVILFFVGLFLSGFYPAFVLSSVNLIDILKGKYIHSKKANVIRKSLVIFQFTMAIILISGIITIFKQLKYMENEPLGVDIEKVLAIKLPAKTVDFKKKFNTFLEELKKVNGVSNVTISNAIPGMEVATFLSNHKAEDIIPENQLFEMHSVDYNYINTYNLKIIAGRAFSKAIIGDRDRIILNEEAVKILGYRTNQSAIGNKVMLEGSNKAVEIIGVIKNYHQQGLNKVYTPVIMFLHERINWINLSFISVKMINSNALQTESQMALLWNRFFPDSTYDHFYVDQFYDKQYRDDRKFSAVFGVFTLLSVFIAVLGLWALAVFEVLLATKSLVIHKIFGATTKRLFFNLLKKFINLILVAIMIGIPISYLIMRSWLNNYAFQTELNWWIFALAATITLLIGLLSVSWQSYRAATRNPVESLRNE